jgi:hypothetical protein
LLLFLFLASVDAGEAKGDVLGRAGTLSFRFMSAFSSPDKPIIANLSTTTSGVPESTGFPPTFPFVSLALLVTRRSLFSRIYSKV